MRRGSSLLLSMSLACGAPAAAPAHAPGHSAAVLERPYGLDVPAGLDRATPAPLLVLLHGYGASGLLEDQYFGFPQLADDRGVLVAYPDGTVDSKGNRFWNATDACCNFDGSAVDDVAYLDAVVDDVEAHYPVDPAQVYVVGHSNGAFMAHRLACDRATRYAAVVAFAGDVWKDPARCAPAGPIAVLQVHGDLDAVIPYAGNRTMPSAPESIATWAAKNACTGMLAPTGQTFDLVPALPGAETSPAAYACAHGAAELWTIHGGTHVPFFKVPDWGNHVFDWLSAHRRR